MRPLFAGRPAAALLLALTAVALPASTAHATSVDAECLGSFGRTFSPPVVLTPAPLTVTVIAQITGT